MTRDEWKEVEKDLHKPEVRRAMAGRCEEQGHDWENCCSADFGMLGGLGIYQGCKWCGATRK